jgi:DnaJ-class molecular chaperone
VAEPEDSYDPDACPPCRGTGRVVSNLGGERSEVSCPWCEGSGRFQREHDAQAARRDAQSPATSR